MEPTVEMEEEEAAIVRDYDDDDGYGCVCDNSRVFERLELIICCSDDKGVKDIEIRDVKIWIFQNFRNLFLVYKNKMTKLPLFRFLK